MRGLFALLLLVTFSGTAEAQLPERRGLPPRIGLPLRVAIEPTIIVTTDDEAFAKIILESMDGCAPCERWRREVAPGLVKAGWKVQTVYVSEGSVPRWRVCIGDRCWRVDAGNWLDNLRLTNIVNQWRLERELRRSASVIEIQQQ